MRGLWDQFRSSGLWRSLRRLSFLRQTLYFCIELHRTWRKPQSPDSDFERARDPWSYESSPLELDRFRRQLRVLSTAGTHFPRTLEIGCAEGRFTESLAQIARELVVLDVSDLALSRARARTTWGPGVTFSKADLRTDPLGSGFDLVVAAGILEYFPRPATLRHAIAKLVDATSDGGYLLLETTRAAQPSEDARWWRLMPRGRRIHDLAGEHPRLLTVAADLTPEFCITLYRKQA